MWSVLIVICKEYGADALPENSLVSTTQPDQKNVCAEKTSNQLDVVRGRAGTPVAPSDQCGSQRLPQSLSYFFSTTSTEARVFSQSRCMVQPPPVWSNAMVKFSTGDAVFETCMSTRASSSLSYL